jgi:hypothetical protein
MKWEDDRWRMKLKELATKRSQSYPSNVAKTVKTTVMAAGVLAKIRNEHLLNTSLECYQIVNCLSVMKIIATKIAVNRLEMEGREVSWKEKHNR